MSFVVLWLLNAVNCSVSLRFVLLFVVWCVVLVVCGRCLSLCVVVLVLFGVACWLMLVCC